MPLENIDAVLKDRKNIDESPLGPIQNYVYEKVTNTAQNIPTSASSLTEKMLSQVNVSFSELSQPSSQVNDMNNETSPLILKLKRK